MTCGVARQKRTAELEETLALKRLAVEQADQRLQCAAQQADAHTRAVEQASAEEARARRSLRHTRRRTEAEQAKLHAVDGVMQQVCRHRHGRRRRLLPCLG